MTKRKGSDASAETDTAGENPRDGLSAPARRALAEAATRRAKRDAEARDKAPPPKEIDGVDGLEPVRYGDWENKGRASDF